jgi:hypothetical protein
VPEPLAALGPITAQDVLDAALVRSGMLDGQGFSLHIFECPAIPEITRHTRVARGKANPKISYGSVTFVLGRPVQPSAIAVAAEVNRVRGILAQAQRVTPSA